MSMDKLSLAGRSILSRLVHPQKAPIPIDVTLLGIVMLLRLVHSRKTPVPMDVTLFGIVMLSSPLW